MQKFLLVASVYFIAVLCEKVTSKVDDGYGDIYYNALKSDKKIINNVMLFLEGYELIKDAVDPRMKVYLSFINKAFKNFADGTSHTIDFLPFKDKMDAYKTLLHKDKSQPKKTTP